MMEVMIIPQLQFEDGESGSLDAPPKSGDHGASRFCGLSKPGFNK